MVDDELSYVDPDMSSPDAWFAGGPFIYAVGVYSAPALPWGPGVPGTNLAFSFGATSLKESVQNLIDSRYKVVVWRMKRRPPRYTMPIVRIEFLPTLEKAEARRQELLAEWDFASYESSPVISRRDARRLRRETHRRGKTASAD